MMCLSRFNGREQVKCRQKFNQIKITLIDKLDRQIRSKVKIHYLNWDLNSVIV